MSALWLLPDPTHNEKYEATPRHMNRGLLLFYTATIFLSCMAAMPVILWGTSGIVQSAALQLCGVAYAVAIFACCVEVFRSCGWEDVAVLRRLAERLPQGREGKSRTFGVLMNDAAEFIDPILVTTSCIGVAALVQTFTIWHHPDRAPSAIQEFYCLAIMYQSVIMSIGFFLQEQAVLDKHERLRQVVLVENLLTLLWPLFVVGLGPNFTGHASVSECLHDMMLWQ